MAVVVPALIGLTTTTAIGLAANKVFERLVPTKQLVAGFPRWRWVLSVFTQMFVFCPLVYLAWSHSSAVAGFSASTWFSMSAAQLPGFERWYVYALFASQSRDMIPRMPKTAGTIMIVHHWVVVIASALALLAPQGFGIFIAGTFALELGSLTFNLRKLYPENKWIVPLYQTVMTASNIAAPYFGFLMLKMKLPLPLKALFFVADVGVCIGRQHHALKDLGFFGGLSHAAEPEPAADASGDGVARNAFKAARRLTPCWDSASRHSSSRRQRTHGAAWLCASTALLAFGGRLSEAPVRSLDRQHSLLGQPQWRSRQPVEVYLAPRTVSGWSSYMAMPKTQMNARLSRR